MTVRGNGPKPSSITISRTGSSENVSMARTPTGSDGNWYWSGNNWNCSSTHPDCGRGTYTVTLAPHARLASLKIELEVSEP